MNETNGHTIESAIAVPIAIAAPLTVATSREYERFRFTRFIARYCLSPSDAIRVIAVASAHGGEGVTYTVEALAAEIEELTSRSVGVVSGKALAWAAASKRSSEVANPSDIVIIDAGAVWRDGDCLRAASTADGVLFVVEAGRTTKSEIRRAADTITSAGGLVLGLVLNKRRYFVPAWLYKVFRHS